MPWVESASRSFLARHESADAGDAEQVLHLLEATRERLAEYFAPSADGVTVVLHRSALSLSIAMPLLPVAWLATDPAARRYVAGWSAGGELHVLTAAALAARASGVPGSAEMLRLTAAALYARRAITTSNSDLMRVRAPARHLAQLRWAWLLEGAARWFAGQSEHARPAIARRLREGGAPGFPPGVRDALLLGPTVIDLLAREEGEMATARLCRRLDPEGPRAALSKAFSHRTLRESELAWRSHLRRITRAP